MSLATIVTVTKKIFGYIILAGFGVLFYVATHHFGAKRFQYFRFVRVLGGKSVIARRRLRERKKLLEEIKDAAGPAV